MLCKITYIILGVSIFAAAILGFSYVVGHLWDTTMWRTLFVFGISAAIGIAGLAIGMVVTFFGLKLIIGKGLGNKRYQTKLVDFLRYGWK